LTALAVAIRAARGCRAGAGTNGLLLATFCPSYRFICYTVSLLGRPIDPELPGDDRPDLVRDLYAKAHQVVSDFRIAMHS
jgi:hypothetical protein